MEATRQLHVIVSNIRKGTNGWRGRGGARMSGCVKRVLLATLLSCGGLAAHAQQFHASLSHFSTDNGLCSNAISCIKQDDYGYLWMATWNGLSRFDGFNFYNYPTGGRSRIPHLHNRILDIVIDSYQNVWMRMYDGRVFVLNRLTDTIENPFKNIVGNEGFMTRQPLTVTSDGDVIAIINDIGIYRIRFTKQGYRTQLITTGKLTPTAIVEGYHGDLWVGTSNGIYRMSQSDEALGKQGIAKGENITSMFSNGYNVYAGTKSGRIYDCAYGRDVQLIKETGNGITSLFRDSHGVFWYTTGEQGIWRYNPHDGSSKLFTQTVLVPQYDSNGASVSEVNGTLWVRMNKGGFGYYNRHDDTIEYFHNNPTNPWDLTNAIATYLALPEGVVWESTSRRGLERLEILKKTIQRMPLFEDATATNINETRALYYDRNRRILLIGNKSGSLILTDGKRRRVINETGTPGGLGRIYSITQDHQGNYLIASKGNGVIVMKPADATGDLMATSFRFTQYKSDEKSKNSLNSDLAYKAIEDKRGNIWVATYGGGVNVITKDKRGHTLILNRDNALRHYPKNAYGKARSLAMDHNGNIWVGTTDGLLVMSLSNGNVKIEAVEDKTDIDHDIQSKDVVCVGCDPQGHIWVGTNGGGLSRYTGRDENGRFTFDNFGNKDGLPSEEIKSITFDEKGNVWFATEHILCSFDVHKRIFSTYSFQDGVDDTICSEDAAIMLPGGTILFGTLDGYYKVDRRRLKSQTGSMLKLRITDFFLNEETMSPRLNDTYDFYVPDAKEVKLPSHSSVFSFRFAAMDYQLQHRVHYQYMLEGYDKEWRNADKNRMATYAGVPAGTYTFKVKAFLLESPEKYDMKSIKVTVPPFFLLSPVALWIYFFLAVIAVTAAVYLRKKKIERIRKMRVLKVGPQDIAFKETDDYEFVKRQLEWLEKNFSDSNMKIDDMVTASSMSRTSFYNQLKTLTGLSPKEFITDFRLKKAVMYLENSTLTISEIAYNTGFNDPVYFTRIFKNKMGVTPSKYRANHGNETKEGQEPSASDKTVDSMDTDDAVEIIDDKK